MFYTVIQVVPILSRSPEPFGFGKGAADTGVLMLPLAISTIFVGPVLGFIIARLYSVRALIVGSGILSAAFALITIFYLDETFLSVLSAMMNIGYLFVTVSAVNIIILSTPKQLVGTSLGVSTLLKYIGAGIGPALAALYMHTHLRSVLIASNSSGNALHEFIPSADSYLIIFFYSTIISLIGLCIAIFLALRSPRCQHHSVEERGNIGPISQMIITEISKWSLVEIRPHRFGGVEFCVKRKSIGHVHGDKIVDLPVSSSTSK